MNQVIAERLRQRVDDAIARHTHEVRDTALNLIASQNLMSPAARAALSSALADKIAAGSVGTRNHLGARHVDALERALLEALETLYGTPHVEYRLMSGAIANQMGIIALVARDSRVLVMPRAASGDPSVQATGYPGWVGARVSELPFDYERMNVDLEGFRRAVRSERPDWVIVGGSRPLFPYPIAEMAAEAAAVGCRIFYDGAHILGLWAGRQFQDPLAEGAAVVTGSTQKTLPGPIGGLLLTRDAGLLRKVASRCDEVLSNYGNARVASLAITLCEMVACGENYAAALVRNARALGTALAEEGVTVVGLDQGVSASHQVLIVTDNVRLTEIPTGLEAATLLCTVVRLVTRNGDTARAGLRLGTNELTRRGMGPSEMKVVASLFRRLLIDGEPPDQVAKAAYELRRQFNDVHYTLSAATSTTARG